MKRNIEATGKAENSPKGLKLTDRLDLVTKDILIKSSNPIENLSFKDVAENKKIPSNANFFLILFVAFLLSTSVLLNPFFSKNLDPILFKSITSSISFIKRNIHGVKNVVIDSLIRPYVVTIGEYGNMAIAKEEAERLLPKLRQIYIKELPSGILTFEVERLGSKKEAYELANELIQNGFEVVHVRYLPDK